MTETDYLIRDLYCKDKYTLRSIARKRQFNFIKYNGNNYEQVCAFIHEGSPNTRIIPENKLRVGSVYTYSGKTFKMFRVFVQYLRCVIASNPYLVTENGEWLPLALKHQDAVDYLKMNRHHKIFAYEDILATYKYNPDFESFIVYDREHPKGVAINDLPDFHEWYIGGDDDIHRFYKDYKVCYQKALHIVDFRLDFNNLVETLEMKRYIINKQLHIKGRPVMFNVSWENYARRKALYTTCLNENQFKTFVDALYNIIYEETRGDSKVNKQTLGPYAAHPFTLVVGELRNYYNHAQDTYVLPESRARYSIDKIFLKYLEQSGGPQTPNDYAELQSRLLSEYEHFLTIIINAQKEKNRIKATIKEDDYGNLSCGKILLNNRYRFLRGCTAIIEQYEINPNEKTKESYLYSCRHVTCVIIMKKGVICKDNEGTYYVDRYILKESAAADLGKEVLIKSIRPFRRDVMDSIYFGEVKEYSILGDTK